MKVLRHPTKPLFHIGSDVDVTIPSNEVSDEKKYHTVSEANQQLHRQSSQKLNDTVGSHADHNLSYSTVKPPDPVNRTALAIEKFLH